MINKEKISKVDLYDGNGNHFLSSKLISFPKDFFKIKREELVVVKDKNMPQINKDEHITAVFEYMNGTRIKYVTKVDLCTEMQLNFHVDEGIILEDRRKSYKVNFPFDGICSYFERGGEPVTFDPKLPLHFFNINLGGVLFNADFEFETGDMVNMLFMFNGIPIELNSEILRLQNDTDGNFVGYGAKFLEVSSQQEELLAKFIFQCQVSEREKKQNKFGNF